MDTWKVTLQVDNKTIEITVTARSFSDAYIQTEMSYPNCRILHIKKQENDDKKRF